MEVVIYILAIPLLVNLAQTEQWRMEHRNSKTVSACGMGAYYAYFDCNCAGAGTTSYQVEQFMEEHMLF
jgi:hypothetical protein